MKLIATSDLHGHLPTIPPCDLLVIAGDVCPSADHSVVFQRSWLETNFSEWLLGVPAANIIGIAGNHDFALEKFPGLGSSLPWTYLEGTWLDVGGVRFHGLPWVPNLSRWAYHLDDHALYERCLDILDNTDVLISHGPPYGLCDFTVPDFGSVHAGFPGLLSELNERIRPELVICGHIHEGYGYETTAGGTMVANVALQTENYEPKNRPVEFQITQRGRLIGFDASFGPPKTVQPIPISQIPYAY